MQQTVDLLVMKLGNTELEIVTLEEVEHEPTWRKYESWMPFSMIEE